MHKETSLQEAKRLICQKDYFSSIIISSKLICEKINHYEAFNLRGYAKNKLGFYFHAIEDFEKAIKINPNLLEAKVNVEDISQKIVPRWHIPMINDHERNKKYFEV